MLKGSVFFSLTRVKVVSCCEHGNELAVSIKLGEIPVPYCVVQTTN
jgi:hypothetical protein